MACKSASAFNDAFLYKQIIERKKVNLFLFIYIKLIYNKKNNNNNDNDSNYNGNNNKDPIGTTVYIDKRLSVKESDPI